MDKLKAILKSLVFGLIMCVFLIASALIAKALKLTTNRTYIFQGCIMLLSIIVPLLFAGSKDIGGASIGLNMPTKKSLKDILFYIPFIVAFIPLVVVLDKSGGIKQMVVAMFFFGCVAIASEVYFRGLIQSLLRTKFSIIPLVVICGLIFAACNAYYFNRITNIKHIAILIICSMAFAGVATMVIEAKGNILVLIVIDALYFFLTAYHDLPAKKLIFGQGICLGILFIYGMYMLIRFMKENKKDEPVIEENNEIDDEGFNEEGNIDLS